MVRKLEPEIKLETDVRGMFGVLVESLKVKQSGLLFCPRLQNPQAANLGTEEMSKAADSLWITPRWCLCLWRGLQYTCQPLKLGLCPRIVQYINVRIQKARAWDKQCRLGPTPKFSNQVQAEWQNVPSHTHTLTNSISDDF